MIYNPLTLTPMSFCNQPEHGIRQVCWLVFFEKHHYSFNNSLRQQPIDLQSYILKVRVNTVSKFKRAVNSKDVNYSESYDVKVQAEFMPINSADVTALKKFQRRNHYVLAIISNDGYQLIGNSREPMSLKIEDDIQDNGSGDDVYNIVVEGTTSIYPKMQELSDNDNETFSVLLITPPTL